MSGGDQARMAYLQVITPDDDKEAKEDNSEKMVCHPTSQ